jgi:hypothetical protein
MALAEIRHDVVHALANTYDAQQDARAALDHGEDA